MNLNNYYGIDTKDLTNIPPDKDKGKYLVKCKIYGSEMREHCK